MVEKQGVGFEKLRKWKGLGVLRGRVGKPTAADRNTYRLRTLPEVMLSVQSSLKRAQALAGKRHHHIWQHIQRGFATNEFNDHHIWVYRRTGDPERTVTRLHGQEKFFYGEENSAADINITNLENQLVGFINNARVAVNGERLDPKVAGIFVSSLEIRSAYLRVEFSNLLERMVTSTREHLSSPEVMAIAMQAVLKNEPNLLKSEFEKMGAEPVFHEIFAQIVHEVLPKELIARRREFSASLDQFLGPMLSKSAEVAKDSQIRALGKNFSSTERTTSHQAMNFEVLRVHDGELILPDTGLALLMKQGVRPTSFKGDSIETIVVPISSSAAIIGSKKRNIVRPIGLLNSVLASCSFESFIARKKDNMFQSLVRKIGKNAKLLDNSAIAKIVRSVEF